MRIVHFSTTRLAGAPIRLVRALQAHTDVEARLVDIDRWDQFEHDLVFSESRDEVLELCEQADAIHLHNYLDYDSTSFGPVDFAALRDRGKRFVRHLHSTPETIAARMGQTVAHVLACPIPSLVMAGYQERSYPAARVVRIVVPQDDAGYRPTGEQEGVVFTPSLPTSAWAERWNTKGTPETVAMLQRVARATGCAVRVVEGRPLVEVMREKQRALAIVDDLVTGSYHTSGLEGLSVGKPVLCFLDERIRRVLAHVSGSGVCPFVNVRLEDAEEVLGYLVTHPDEAAELGRDARAWLERHWSDAALAREYAQLYEQLLDGEPIRRQEELRVDDRTRFSAIVLPDLVWQARRHAARRSRPLPQRARELAAREYRRLLPRSLRDAVRRARGLPVAPR